MKKFGSVLIFALGIMFSGCDSDPLNVDVSDIDLDLKVERFEIDLFSTKGFHSAELHKKYGTFFQRFVEDMVNVGSVHDPALDVSLGRFVSDPEINKVKELCFDLDEDLEKTLEEVRNGFKHYRYYFADRQIPQLVTYISGFNYAVMVTPQTLGLGLDMYLGVDNEYYGMLQLPLYQRQRMTKEYMSSDLMKAWLATEFQHEENETLLDFMISKGKLMYLLDAMMPAMADSIKIGFSSDQIAWCEKNEFSMWAYLIDEQKLYSKSAKEIAKLIGEGPFTTGFDKSSPARTGEWIGWRIVQSYMEQSDVSFEELMLNKDSQALLKRSKYKPSK